MAVPDCTQMTRLHECALLVIANADLLKQWVNGDEKTSVPLGGKLTPTIRKLVADIDARESAAAQKVIDAGLKTINTQVNKATTSATNAANSASAAATSANNAIESATQAKNSAAAAAASATRAGSEADRAESEANKFEAMYTAMQQEIEWLKAALTALRLHTNEQFAINAVNDIEQSLNIAKLRQDVTVGDASLADALTALRLHTNEQFARIALTDILQSSRLGIGPIRRIKIATFESDDGAEISASNINFHSDDGSVVIPAEELTL